MAIATVTKNFQYYHFLVQFGSSKDLKKIKDICMYQSKILEKKNLVDRSITFYDKLILCTLFLSEKSNIFSR